MRMMMTRQKITLQVRKFLSAPLRRFGKHQKGSTAVEFGLVVLPFIALLFAIIETAIIFFAGQALETVVASSARLILTGQADNGGITTPSAFKTAVCNNVSGLFDCASKLQIDVRKFSTFGSINLPPPQLDTNGNLTDASSQFQASAPGDIVVVRLFYQYPVYASIWNPQLANSGGKHMLVATAAFRNEPYK
jgi:Flp pilus assembly protein TadG